MAIEANTALSLVEQLNAGEISPGDFAKVMTALARGESAATVLQKAEAERLKIRARTAGDIEKTRVRAELTQQERAARRRSAEEIFRQAAPFAAQGSDSDALKSAVRSLGKLDAPDLAEGLRLRARTAEDVAAVEARGLAETLSARARVPTVKLTEQDIRTGLKAGGPSGVSQLVEQKIRLATQARQGQKVGRIASRLGVLDEDVVAQAAEAARAGRASKAVRLLRSGQQAAQEAAAAEAASAARSGTLKRFGLLGGGLALAALVGKSLFGGRPEPAGQLTPQLQALLLQRLGGQRDTSRTLIDMARLVRLLKGVQDLAGVQAQPRQAASIV